jgi:putative membrane protein
MLLVRVLVVGLGVAATAPSAAAHAGAHPVEAGPPGWTFDPVITAPLTIVLVLWIVGQIRLWERSRRARPMLRRRGAMFLAGWAVLATSLVSPLHEGGERSFMLHMVEHELIMLGAAALLVLSKPLSSMAFALPSSGRRAAALLGRRLGLRQTLSVLSDPVVATVLQAVALVAWHVPALFDRALGHVEWHIAQHASFLFTALLFWSAMFSARSPGLAAMCLFVTSLAGGALGALMSFAESPWYAGYAAMDMAPFGLTPAEDQAVAGLIMWVPGGLVHAGAALWMLGNYLGTERTRATSGN